MRAGDGIQYQKGNREHVGRVTRLRRFTQVEVTVECARCYPHTHVERKVISVEVLDELPDLVDLSVTDRQLPGGDPR